MPDIASVLKAEISRLARKEGRLESAALKKLVSSQRSDLIALRRQVQGLERQLRAVVRALPSARSTRVEPAADSAANGLRFRAKGMANNRKRLGLSAEDFGLLVGATAQSVYAWEAQRSKPRAKALAAIAALRTLGKREVAKRLEALKKA